MLSRGPQRLGLCSGDVARVSEYVNEAQQRLINVAGEDGWYGGWAKLVFNVPRTDPYITLPNEFARAISFNVCRTAIRIQNEFYETLEAGIGLRTACDGRNGCGPRESYDRATVCTAYDLPPTNQKLRVYITDPRDVGKRIAFIDAKDQNDVGIYSQDVQYPVNGFFLTFTSPFVTSAMVVTSFATVLKDQTYGDIVLKAVDATTGDETLLARYVPSDTAPQYRRYLLTGLPCGCCVEGEPVRPAQVTCLAKYEFRPARYPTDVLIVGNIPALIEECSSLRHSSMDSPEAVALSLREHQNAVRLLQQETVHYLGEIQPAVNLAQFGTAKLYRQRIGTLM